MDQQTAPSEALQPLTLATIPLEILSLILKQFFRSTGAIRIGFESPVANQRTAILLTCRKIHSEALRVLSPNLLTYHFSSTYNMVDELINMPQSRLSQIRIIRVEGYPFSLYTDERYSSTYAFASTLPLFPGLQLDRLIVEEMYHDLMFDDRWGDVGAYKDACTLPQTDGWKEAWFVTPTTGFLTGNRLEDTWGAAQPQAWDKQIKERDGDDSGAECRIYVSKEAGKVGGAENKSTREEWQVAPPNTIGGAVPAGRRKLDDREVLVVFKRGRNAQYVNDGSKLRPEIKRLFDELSWEEIKATKYTPPEGDASGYYI